MTQLYLNRFWCLFLSLFFALPVFAQQEMDKEKEIALQFLRENPQQFELNANDVSDIRVTDVYRSRNNGLTHVWLQQQYHGIPVHNALFGLHVDKSGKVHHLGHRMIASINDRVNTQMPSLPASQAVKLVLENLELDAELPRLLKKINEKNYEFDGTGISTKNIPVKAVYQPMENGEVRLAWDVEVFQLNTPDMWSIRVDAQTGLILDKHNYTVYCKPGHYHRENEMCDVDEIMENKHEAETLTSAGEQYRVFPLPAESPAHGDHELVTDPANLTASPYGWHDTDGAAGAEYTYTRGNNVWAYDDSENDNTASVGNSVDGGPTLNFDFPYDGNADPQVNRDAAITNLFYMNNMVHDFTYIYGFDEQAGNFQDNNYGNGGAGGDEVRAEGLDGGGLDNANFGTPNDGSSGRMQMFLWGRRGGEIITVNEPGAIIGTYPASPAGGWGGAITNTPVTGDVVIVDDGSAEPTLGCGNPVNDLNGKIVLVDRGSCQFGSKALRVQQAGGIACIICNFQDGTQGMGPGNDGGGVNIPTMMIGKTQCDLFKQYVESGLNMSIVLPTQSGPDFLDGDFDNGIIAHEFGHGVSNRLTGGPSNTGCLGNGEQMGEGWSDWLALVTSTKAGDEGTMNRGVGTFVFRQSNDGQGIRRFPYNTDMSVNPITFATVAENTAVHPLGEIWAAVTWDLYWALVEKYGFDEDWTNTDSGNGRAIQLVMDGMKLQPCSPGFLDGRDGIMLADKINYDGADTCLISEVFARRGMGYYADQGSPNNAADGIENFDPIPTCVKELKIAKSTSTPYINPGEEAHFEIVVTNHKDDPATGVVVTDILPVDLQFVSASNGGTFNAGTVSWDLGTIQSGEERTLSYIGKVDEQTGSIGLYRDEMEDDLEWISLSIDPELQPNDFYLQGTDVYTGDNAWKVEDLNIETDNVLFFINSINISGENPALTFWHQYNTESGADAGFLEVQRLGETSWLRFEDEQVYRNGYPSGVGYGTFAIPFLSGFSGNSNGWVQSYFDMSEFIGDEIGLRFRFGTDENTGGDSWIIDDLELRDVLFFDEEACLTSNEGDQACDRAPEKGVIVSTEITSSAFEPIANAFDLRVQPNPAAETLFLTVSKEIVGESQISLIAMDGRVVLQQNALQLNANQPTGINIQNLPDGVYTLRVDSSEGSSIRKVVVRN